MNFHDKYLKYKNKYIQLKNFIGGTRTVQDNIRNCTEIATKNIINHAECIYWPFNNTGDNQKPNSCKPISGNVDKCFNIKEEKIIGNRMNLEKYLNNESVFTIENNIYVTVPNGEVCFGNTITSCLTYCFILNDNTKISVHINPSTTLFAIMLNEIEVLNNEIINVFNAHDKILQKIVNMHTTTNKIKKIILLGALKYNIFKTIDTNTRFIGDENFSLNEDKYSKSEITIKEFLFEFFKDYITKDTIYIERFEKVIDKGNIYLVRSDGTGIILGSDNKLIDKF